MPIRYVILEEVDLCVARWSGVVDIQAVLANWQSYISEPNYIPGRPEIIDFRDCVLDLNLEAMRQILKDVNLQDFVGDRGTQTIALANVNTTYGQLRQYDTLASMNPGIDVTVVTSEEDAIKAVGRSELSLRRLFAASGMDYTTLLIG